MSTLVWMLWLFFSFGSFGVIEVLAVQKRVPWQPMSDWVWSWETPGIGWLIAIGLAVAAVLLVGHIVYHGGWP